MWNPQTPGWWKALTLSWLVCAMAMGIYALIETGSGLAALFSIGAALLPLVAIAKLSKQGKWSPHGPAKEAPAPPGLKTLNGIGLKHLGIGREQSGDHVATVWVVFFYLPILPLRRESVRYDFPGAQSLWQRLALGNITRRHEVLAQGRPEPSEVLRTYLFGWLLFPSLLFGPLTVSLVIMVRLIETGTDIPWVNLSLVLPTLASMLIAIWKLADWDDARGLESGPP